MIDMEADIGFLLPEIPNKPVLLKNLLIEATLSPKVGIKESIDSIDLGIFGIEAEELENATKSDPDHRERAKTVYVTREGRVLLKNVPFIGEEFYFSKGGASVYTSVSVNAFLDKSIPRIERQDRFLSAQIHSHPGFMPPSFQDLEPLLSLSDNRIRICPLVFVVTSDKKYLIFRSENSPFYSPEDFLSMKNGLESQVHNYCEMLQKIPEVDELKSDLDFRLYLLTGEALFREKGLRLVAQVTNLHIYTCGINENVVQKEV